MTIREIAKRIGVSPTTISLVLNNRGNISEETRFRVKAALSEYGYKKQKSLKMDTRSREIRFLKYFKHSMIVDGNTGFISAILDAAEQEARRLGFSLSITTFGEDGISEVFALAQRDHPDGVILLGTEFEEKYIPMFLSIELPKLIVDSRFNNALVDSVVMNNPADVFTAIKYICSLGHKSIGYLHSNVEIENFFERSMAYMEALRSFDIAVDESIVLPVCPTLEGAHQSTKDILKTRENLPTAFFADNDTIALGAMKAFKECGYRIPDEISIVGYDDIPFGRISNPPLTTIKVPTDEIGKRAIRQLCWRMENKDEPIIKQQINGKLVCRGSIRSVNGADV